MVSRHGEAVDHVCRGCQRLIGHDGVELCDDCADLAISRFARESEKRPPAAFKCRLCGGRAFGKDASGLCYSCWRGEIARQWESRQ